MSDLTYIAVEDLQIPQVAVVRSDVVSMLDGYLRGKGMAPRSEVAQ